MTKETRRNVLRMGSGLLAANVLAAPAIVRAQTAPRLKIRRNASLMQPDDPFFADYADAVSALHALSLSGGDGWRMQSLIHLSHCPHSLGMDTSDFLGWHRHYLTAFETICGELIGKPDFALAYWDWTAARGRLPRPFFANGPLNVEYWGDPSNASAPNWPGLVNSLPVRGMSAGSGLQDDPIRGGAFTAASIASIQNETGFTFFSGRLEGSPHNNGHVIAGAGNGHMGNGMSPLDPAFWLHHCNVDRIWAEWQSAGNATPAMTRDYRGQFIDSRGNALAGEFTANSARDFAALGFTYDSLPETAPGSDSQVSSLNDLIGSDDFGTRAESLAADPQLIGGGAVSAEAGVFVATDLPVSAAEIIPALSAQRTFLPINDQIAGNKPAVGTSKILARLAGVRATGDATNIITNVFVNCSYLSPETPFADQHYADTFSFFMPPSEHHGTDVLVEITEPLQRQAKEGRIDPADIRVQLMPIPNRAGEQVAGDTAVSVEKVEIIRT